MPAKVLPDLSDLRRLQARGLTHQEIADEVTRITGYPVARSTITAAFRRAGLSEASKKNGVEVPWVVRETHSRKYPVQMLRLLGRRRRGESITDSDSSRLDKWLGDLEAAGAVVVYDPDTTDGFWYYAGEPDVPGVPVMKKIPES